MLLVGAQGTQKRKKKKRVTATAGVEPALLSTGFRVGIEDIYHLGGNIMRADSKKIVLMVVMML